MDNGLMIASQEANLNLNIEQKTLEACLKTIMNIGHTVHQNICTGQSVSVPWGAMDWVGTFFAVGVMVILGIGFIALLR